MKKFRPGVSFSDFVIRDSMVKRTRGVEEDLGIDFRRGWLVWIIIVAGFGLLLVRLFYLQIFLGGRYRVLSDQNRIKKIILPAPRGNITDRYGEVLAQSVKTIINVDGEMREAWKRQYPKGADTAHVVGYLGEIGDKEVGLLKETGGKYNPGDLTGRSGLEMEYENILRGIDGGRLAEVDSGGKIVRELGWKAAQPGRDLKLGIDQQLQQVSLSALNGEKGAVVASDPRTGEIRVMVSSPSFDPNSFSGTGVEAVKFLGDNNLPLFNRAVSGVYPPGSTFKLVTTAAAISEGKVNPEFTYQDTGIIKVGDFSYTNWLFTKRGGVEGVVGFVRALTRSTDTFFYKVGELTGAETMAKWAKLMGLGEITGLDIPGEAAGTIPSPEWKERESGERWFLGNTFHMAIGQGDVLATPLQINLLTNVVANGGKKCKPHVVANNASESCEVVPISKEALEIIQKGMTGACDLEGTAFPLFGFKPQVACKTGTAEYMAENGKMKTHGWLTAYAPADNPEISVTVLMEGGGEGSNVAAPIARKILAKYFGVEDNYNYAAIPREISE